MKRYFVLLLLLTVAATTDVSAQKGANPHAHGKHHEEIQAMKIAFMTEMLDLTPAESEKFWPIYNEYWKARIELNLKRIELLTGLENNTGTKADLDQLLGLSKKEISIQENFVAELSKVVSVDKVLKTFVAEDKFKHQLMRQVRKK